MKTLIKIFLLYSALAVSHCAATAQTAFPTGGEMWVTTIRMDALDDDSAFVLFLPQGAALMNMWLACDSAGMGESAPMKVGIQGEQNSPSGRFLDSEAYTLVAGEIVTLPVAVGGVGYITDKLRAVWLYAGATTGQIRIIIEYRNLQ